MLKTKSTINSIIKNFFISLLVLLVHGKAYSQNIYYPFKHHILSEEATSYKFLKKRENEYVIEAVGNNSASGLYLYMPTDVIDLSVDFSWAWQVNEIQKTADLRNKEKDDNAANIQFIFGEYGIFSRPKVLNYAWVGNDAEIDSVISSPRSEDNIKTIVLNNSTSPLGEKIQHKRNILADYKSAFGEHPDKPLEAFGIFTDNDQTGEAVRAVYYISFRSNLL